MREYLVRSPFRRNSAHGELLINRGETIRISSSKAVPHVSSGLIVEKHVGLDLITTFESRTGQLVDKLGYSTYPAETGAIKLVISCLKRHKSLKSINPPSSEFLQQIQEFNRTASGKNPITKIVSDTGAGEWAGYNCNIGEGCQHGCLYCYASGIAVTRFKRVASQAEWCNEKLITANTAKCKKYPFPIMFPTTHDITPVYLPAYRCHLYNILNAGNTVILVSKPHRASIEAICSELSSYRDTMIFRFSIGCFENATLSLWEPGAPSLSERMWCLQYAFEQGFRTSVSAEPMLTDRHGAERLYYALEPFVTEDVWFGKMNNVGSFRKSENADLAKSAAELVAAYQDNEIMAMVDHMAALPKVSWKDSIKEVIKKHAVNADKSINGEKS